MLAGCNPASFVVLWPSTKPENAGTAKRRVVRFDGKELEVWVASPVSGQKPSAYVLRFYGNADRAERHVANEALELQDVEVWGVNYPGYGGSDGPATLRRVAQAAVLAYDEVAREAEGRPIYAFGTSLGTTAAIRLAAVRDVRGLLLINAPPLKRLIFEEYGWWNLFLFSTPIALTVPDEVDSEANARRCRAPAIFVTAEKDGVVPLFYQGRVVRAYAGPKDVIPIPNAGHNDAPDPETMSRIRDAVARMMRGGSPDR